MNYVDFTFIGFPFYRHAKGLTVFKSPQETLKFSSPVGETKVSPERLKHAVVRKSRKNSVPAVCKYLPTVVTANTSSILTSDILGCQYYEVLRAASGNFPPLSPHAGIDPARPSMQSIIIPVSWLVCASESTLSRRSRLSYKFLWQSLRALER